MSEMKYKVDDEVLMKVIIVNVDENDKECPYAVMLHSYSEEENWINLDEIIEEQKPVWRDGNKELWNPETHEEREAGYYWRRNNSQKHIRINWTNDPMDIAVDILWLPASEFPMPAEPEQINLCPFCGQRCISVEISEEDYRFSYHIQCSDCEYRGPEYTVDKEAIAAHNGLQRGQ